MAIRYEIRGAKSRSGFQAADETREDEGGGVGFCASAAEGHKMIGGRLDLKRFMHFSRHGACS